MLNRIEIMNISSVIVSFIIASKIFIQFAIFATVHKKQWALVSIKGCVSIFTAYQTYWALWRKIRNSVLLHISLWLVSTSVNVLSERCSERSFNECQRSINNTPLPHDFRRATGGNYSGNQHVRFQYMWAALMNCISVPFTSIALVFVLRGNRSDSKWGICKSHNMCAFSAKHNWKNKRRKAKPFVS